MQEIFLHYIWLHKLYKSPIFYLKTGEKIEIINPGEYNTNSGPDFLNAKIKIENTVWAGNIEIHVNASDWHVHKHSKNPNFKNVILHVVFNNNSEVKRLSGETIPTIEISFYKSVFDNYLDLIKPKSIIKCSNQLHEVDSFFLSHWTEQLAFERLSQKADLLEALYKKNNQNWEETFYQSLLRAFGLNINSNQFELLATSLPNKILSKHKNNIFQLEALLFGQAGFLNQSEGDDYFVKLKMEYEFLKKKYHIEALNPDNWKFLRLRPGNFPTIRIAQIAKLIQQSNGLFSQIVELNNYKEVSKLFKIEPTEYWDTHYLLNKISPYRKKTIGKLVIQSLVINSIIPVLFFYGRKKNNPTIIDTALSMLEKLPAEKNSITNTWEELNLEIKSAFQSQAFIQLYNKYCKNNECLRCQIGHRVLTKEIS